MNISEDHESTYVKDRLNSDSLVISVILNNLSISLKKNNKLKTIVYPIDARIEGGSLFAILGGSGSGKTTLLNVIAGRYDSSVVLGGELIFEGRANCGVGYVTQTDYLLPYLSVKETLLFAAELRMPLILRQKTRLQVVEDIILELGLKECMNTHIISISGGQRRRVSTAIQIISDPEVLCADEPTSKQIILFFMSLFISITIFQVD